jgi:hypothetical protein
MRLADETTGCCGSALNLDHVALARRDRIGPTIVMLDPARWPEAERVLLIACGFVEPPTLR